ncbi:MAG: M43 family zinc metalloprotease [Bacteroidia bacterium]
MRILFFLTILLLNTYAFAQQHEENILPQFCGTDEMHQNIFKKYPELNDKIIANHKFLNEFTHNYIRQKNNKSMVYKIPVVFHVIHNYGAENITNAQIYDAIRVANRNLRKQNPDTIDIVPFFKPRAADCEIELVLAQKDPNGNCHSGINRIASTLTYVGDHQVKNLIHWDPSKYLNIYVCAEAAGLAGHALLPSTADTLPQWDGIVIQHSYLGSIGTSTPFKSVVLTHELGHYFNLQHIWGGNNVPGFYYLPVAQQANCNYDDDVLDTPNTIGWQTCNLNGTTCDDTLDNVQNFMDYAYCARMLTYGQRDRMHACLNSPIANRNNLWTASNLAATGTDGNNNFCAADFIADKQIICAGQQVKFSDVSYHGIQSRTWTFSGGTPSTSTDSTVTVTYSTPGTYAVTLQVSDGNTTLTKTDTNYITVLPNTGTAIPFAENFENFTDLISNNWFTINPYNDAGFELNNSYAFSGTKSVWLNNYSIIEKGRKDELISPVYNFSNVTNLQISFRYAYARKDSTSTDKLNVFVSTNCGSTWSIKKTINVNNLTTAPNQTTPFFPNNSSQWKTDFITNLTGIQPNTPFRLRFVFESGGGNNFYLDDINIGYNLNTIQDNELNHKIQLFPNPANNVVTLILSGEENPENEITIFDLNGKIVFNTKLNTNTINIDISNIENGVYFIQSRGNSGVWTEKLIIQH